MINRKWVALHILWKAVTSLYLWPTGCEWHCTSCEGQSHDSHHIVFYDHQKVSEIEHLMKDSLITSFAMTHRLWVTLYLFVEGSLIIPFAITNRKWVTLHILWKAVSWVSSYCFLWMTESEWHCTSCERQCHHIIFYDQQEVNDISHSPNGSLITSFPWSTACE